MTLLGRLAALFGALAAAALPAAAAPGKISIAPEPAGPADERRLIAPAPDEPGGAGTPARLEYRASAGSAPVVLRESPNPVVSPRLVAQDDAGILFASWREMAPHGTEHWTSVSLDRGASWSAARTMNWEIPLKAGRLLPGVASPRLPEPLEASPSGRLHIVQFETVGLQAWRSRLSALGAEVLSHLPHNAHIVRMPQDLAEAVAREPFVRWVGPYHPGYRLAPDLVGEILAGGSTARRYRLQTFTPGPEEKALLARDVGAAGGEVVLNVPNGYLIEAMLAPAQLLRVVRSEHLLWLDPWAPKEQDMDNVRAQSGANYIEGIGNWSGQDVRGEVMDGGIQRNPNHQDHDSIRIHGPEPNVESHGTSTWGIVFGNGNRDGDGVAQATGLLPSGIGYFFDYSFLTDRHQRTSELVQAPIFAVFQSNSWGDSRNRAYNSTSSEMDDIIWQYDIAIFQSQSNAGNQDSRPQAWAKNIISVGGINHYNTQTLDDDCWCSGASIGPAEDGRVKPDLAHWYDSIYTTSTPSTGYTTSFGGTSAATPIAAGIGGLIIQMWADNVLGNNPQGTTVFQKRPHASTIKALMINTAEQYPFSGTSHDRSRMKQGWGLPSARRFYDRRDLLKVVDESSVLTELDWDVWTAPVAAGQPELKVTMVYTDRAGTTSSTLHRINDVNLKVTSPDGATVWHGNVGLDASVWSSSGGGPDTKNTVENVFIQNPAPGDWRIEVSADEINQDVHSETPGVDQDYALVVYGAGSLTSCRDSVPAPTGVSAVPHGTVDNVIQVSWTGTQTASGYRIYRSTDGCGGPWTFAGSVGPSQTIFNDEPVSGGTTYHYVVRSSEDCESRNSNCSSATASGACTLTPAFAGLSSASSGDSPTCGVTLSWPAASPACGGPVRYNVYRSTSATFTPGPANRVAFCETGLTMTDTAGLTSGQRVYYIVRAEDTGGRPDGPCGGIEETNAVTLSTRPFGTRSTLLDNKFESGMEGWTSSKGTPAAFTGDFIAGNPVGTFNGSDPAQPEDDHTASGTQCLYTAANPNAQLGIDDVDDGEVIATSPLINASGFAASELRLWRWHYNRDLGSDSGDYFAMDLSNNSGASWTNLETLGTNVRENFWKERAFDLDTILPLTSSMRVRIRSADGTASGNIVESAIDDVLVTGSSSCSTRSGPPGVVTGAPALLVSIASGMIRLTWGTDCGGTTGYGVYRGDLLAGYSSIAPVPGLCGLTARTADVAPDSGSYFYLIAPNDGAAEGTLGTDSAGARRPAAAAPCFPRAAPLDACAP